MRVLFWLVVVKKELNGKAKLSTCWSVYVSAITCGCVWIMTKRMRSWSPRRSWRVSSNGAYRSGLVF